MWQSALLATLTVMSEGIDVDPALMRAAADEPAVVIEHVTDATGFSAHGITAHPGCVGERRVSRNMLLSWTFRRTHARQVCVAMAIEQYVDVYADKGFGGYEADGSPIFHTDVQPDIAFDDIEECALGTVNLMVRERGFTPGYVAPEHRR